MFQSGARYWDTEMKRNEPFSMLLGNCSHGYMRKTCTKLVITDIIAFSKGKGQGINRAKEFVKHKYLRRDINLGN